MMDRKAKLVAWSIAFENTEEARRKYEQKFQEKAPARQTIHRWVQRFLKTGNINKRAPGSGRPLTASGDDSQTVVEEAINENPNTSVRDIAAESGMSKSSVHRCMKKMKLHPYKYTMVQELTSDDDDRRLQFCELIRLRVQENENFHKLIIFSDEATFHVNGSVNKYNLHYWSVENPHAKMEHFQDRHSVTIWCMLDSSGVIEYDISPETMNSVRYCHILEEKVVPFLTQRRNSTKLYQQDGAPPHYSRAAREILDNKVTNRWIGRRGPIEWPARSPDLTVCDFFLWGALRERVYRHRPRDRTHLVQRIQEEIHSFPPRMYEEAYRSFLRRINACIGANGWQFEHFV
jgi:predicted DNA-binding protein YlxM (UPF0122 family)